MEKKRKHSGSEWRKNGVGQETKWKKIPNFLGEREREKLRELSTKATR
jgi:hypothetical protein